MFLSVIFLLFFPLFFLSLSLKTVFPLLRLFVSLSRVEPLRRSWTCITAIVSAIMKKKKIEFREEKGASYKYILFFFLFFFLVDAVLLCTNKHLQI